MRAKELSFDQVKGLARAHISHYSKLIEAALDGKRDDVRLTECEAYLRVWSQLNAQLTTTADWPDKASLKALNELQDAIDSGDYDDLINTPSVTEA